MDFATGRVIQIGDAAQSYRAGFGSWRYLALEDAITLASCLQLAVAPGSATPGAGVPLGTRVYNLLRYERASCTQKMAFVNAQALSGTTDWAAAKRNPKAVRLRYPEMALPP